MKAPRESFQPPSSLKRFFSAPWPPHVRNASDLPEDSTKFTFRAVPSKWGIAPKLVTNTLSGGAEPPPHIRRRSRKVRIYFHQKGTGASRSLRSAHQRPGASGS